MVRFQKYLGHCLKTRWLSPPGAYTQPPLLLANRVIGLDEAGSMKTGTIWTQTDVTEDAWYMHEGRMPAGIMIESGQADLMLISYLGIDFLNQSDSVPPFGM